MAVADTLGSTLTFNSQTVGKVISMELPPLEAEDIDTSALDTTSYRTHMRFGLRDGGEMRFTCHLDIADAGQDAINSALTSTAGVAVSVVSAGATVSFSAYVQSFQVRVEFPATTKLDVVLRVVGVVTVSMP